MKNSGKYKPLYTLPPQPCFDWVKRERIETAPAWCSVDLRDGNQALVVPMSLEQKIEFFRYLVSLGFTEIEVGFPAASETEFTFLRTLIEGNLIPDHVTVQVLTQSREHIIEKTFEALRGAKHAIVHLYNSTSAAQREQVFKKNKEEIKEIAISGAKLLKQYAEKTPGSFRFEYSPESFTGTEPEYALEVCNAVLEVWRPTSSCKAIINLPSTVQLSMPHVYASQIEYLSKHLVFRENVVLSVHPHNDRGCGVAEAELGVLAGAQRVEGTLFGNGERTGNADLITLAMNLFMHGVDPKLNFSDMPDVVQKYELFTGMKVNERQPYGGELVFTAFSGSHQDAIAKGMHFRKEHNSPYWNVPYLAIDPEDVGRSYDSDVIRINSQSGKGGIGYLLEQNYGFHLPKKLAEEFGYHVKSVSDHEHRELLPPRIHELFTEQYVNVNSPLGLSECRFHRAGSAMESDIAVSLHGDCFRWSGTGSGMLEAFSDALQKNLKLNFSDLLYEEHALQNGVKSAAAAYVGIPRGGKIYWGAGIDSDILTASAKAMLSAVNRIAEQENLIEPIS